MRRDTSQPVGGTPWTRDQATRLQWATEQYREARRAGRTVESMLDNLALADARQLEDIRKHLPQRHSLPGSSQFEFHTRCVRTAITIRRQISFMRMFLAPYLADEQRGEPDATLYLQWVSRAGLPILLDAQRRRVGQVIRGKAAGGFYVRLFLTPLPDAAPDHDGAALGLGRFTTRKAAVKALVAELHKRCYGLFGAELDIPEWRALK